MPIRWLGAGRERLLERETILDVSREEAFTFFAAAENLEAITPDFLRFTLLTVPPIAMASGVRIAYRIRLFGWPVRWLTEITAWEPPHRFVDTQVAGPYRQWIHEHVLEADGSRTRMLDRVRYRVPGGPIEPLLHRWFVGPTLRRIFDHRERSILQWAAKIVAHPSAEAGRLRV